MDDVFQKIGISACWHLLRMPLTAQHEGTFSHRGNGESAMVRPGAGGEPDKRARDLRPTQAEFHAYLRRGRSRGKCGRARATRRIDASVSRYRCGEAEAVHRTDSFERVISQQQE